MSAPTAPARGAAWVARGALLLVLSLGLSGLRDAAASAHQTATQRAAAVRHQQAAYAAASVGWLALIVLLRHRSTPPPVRLRSVLLVALAVRALLLTAPPSDDVQRYLWEGRVRLAGFNPYLLAPDDERLAHLRDANWPRINHSDHAAIYGPAAELLFAALAALAPNLPAFKLLALAADVGTIALLVGWLRRRREPAAWVLVYALCPATLHAFAQRGHLDALMVLGLALLLWAVDALAPAGRARWGAALAGAGLGWAIGVKWVAVLLVPWFIAWIANDSRRRRDWSALGVGLAALLAIPLLGALAYRDAGLALFGPLRNFAAEFRTLDFTRQMLIAVVGESATRWLTMLSLAGLAVFVAWRRWPVQGASLWLLGTLLLLAPTVHPWYLTWLLPGLCVAARGPAAAWLVLPVTMVFALEAEHARATTGVWAMPTWTAPAVFVPFYVALGALAVRRVRGWDKAGVRSVAQTG